MNFKVSSRSLNLRSVAQTPTYRNETIKVDERLRKLGIDYQSDSDINFLKLLQSLLRERIFILTEDRGLISDFTDNEFMFSLQSTIRTLFHFKNSADPLERYNYEIIQEMFEKLFKMKFDVTMNQVLVRKAINPILMLRPKNEFSSYNQKNDYSIELDIEKETLSAYEPNLVFHDNNTNFSISEAPGGSYELIMVLTAIHMINATTIILDEPGKTLYPALLQELRTYLVSNKSKTILYTTHSPHLIGNDDLKETVVCCRDPNTNTTKLRSLKDIFAFQDLKTVTLEKFCYNPQIKSMFFAKKFCFLEGKNDINLFIAIIDKLRERKKKLDGEIISLGGKDDSQKAIKLARHLFGEWILITDFDAWIGTENNKTIEDSRIGKILNELGKIDKLKDTWSNSSTPYVTEIREKLHIKERENNIFTWKSISGDLEGIVKTTKPNFSKKNWRKMNFEDISNLVDDLLNDEKNLPLKDLITFLSEKKFLVS